MSSEEDEILFEPDAELEWLLLDLPTTCPEEEDPAE